MVLTLLKYNNRKLYIARNKNEESITNKFGVGYTTVSMVRSWLGVYPNLKLKVIHVRTKEDVTKSILVSALKPELFILEDLVNLVRGQAQSLSGQDRNSLVKSFYTSGVEL